MTESSQNPWQVCVIGAGPGGYVAAIRLAQRGMRVALIEKNAVGGVCLNWGCIPSKALIHAASILDGLRGADKMGILVDNPRVDFARLMGWKDGVIHKLQGGIRQLLGAHGVTLIEGEAEFLTPHRLQVRPAQGDVLTLDAENFLIATGSSPQALPGLAVDGQRMLDVRDLLSMTTLPASLAVIGGGVIGLEMAMAFSKLGAQVTVLEALEDILPDIDPDCRQILKRALKRRKISLKTGVRAGLSPDASQSGPLLTLSCLDDAGQTTSLAVEKALVAVGRSPNTASLGLARAGLATDERGFIPVDAQCRSRSAHIFAIGDVTRGPLLAHRASHEGLVAAAAIAGDGAASVDTRAMPAAVYTDPELASVGWTEAQARAAGREVRIGSFPLQASGRALTMDAGDGLVKLIADAQTDELLGAHIAGPHAADLIAEAALAIELGASAADVAMTVHAHPTLPESLMEAAEALHHQAIHLYQKP